MIKYVPEDTSVVFAEIPDEICLAINLSNCPHHCPGCHSAYLQTDCGQELTKDGLMRLIEKHKGVTCILFLGGDGDKEGLQDLARHIYASGYKTAWYSGEVDIDFYKYGWVFDYIKVGPYIEEKGPLDNPNTNQRLYKLSKLHNQGMVIAEDITNKFWKHANNQ